MEIERMRRIVRTVLLVTLSFPILVSVACAQTDTSTATTRSPEVKTDANDPGFYHPPATTEPYPLTNARKVKNVILCIGDGMGLSQVALARVKAAGLGGKLTMERLPVTGLVRTHSADSCVTDSAAAATALASGVKTKNGMVGMTPDEQAYCTILEAARDKGMATGLVVTSTITHATPACFAAHVKARAQEDKIAEQLLANKVNVLFGGGRKFFLPRSNRDSARKDALDLLAAAKEAGYLYLETADELSSAHGPYVLGLFQLGPLKTTAPEPSLALLTQTAIQILTRDVEAGGPKSESAGTSGTQPRAPTRKRGFFLMVEGSQIDWTCHANDAKGTVRQTLLFDQAVAAAVEFALRDGNTLVLVTADHETGGLTLIGGGNEDKGDTELTVRWSTKSHTGTPVPLYALGPGAAQFAGVWDNTDIPRKIARLLDIQPFPRPTK
jgi:alkaline phosphatase